MASNESGKVRMDDVLVIVHDLLCDIAEVTAALAVHAGRDDLRERVYLALQRTVEVLELEQAFAKSQK